MPQPKPITLTPVDIAMLKREHIDWEKEDVRDQARLAIQRKLQALRIEREQLRGSRDFWRNCFILLASAVVFVTVLGVLGTFAGW